MKFALLLICIYEYFSWYYKPQNQMYFEPWKFKFEDIEIIKPTERKSTVVAVDFDDTIAYTHYPTIIKPLPHAFDVLKVLMDDPYTILILWTCREGEYLKQALDFCELYGVKFDYVNENCKRNLDMYVTDCRKVSADIYIDDKGYQGKEGVEKLWSDWYFWMKENNMI